MQSGAWRLPCACAGNGKATNASTLGSLLASRAHHLIPQNGGSCVQRASAAQIPTERDSTRAVEQRPYRLAGAKAGNVLLCSSSRESSESCAIGPTCRRLHVLYSVLYTRLTARRPVSDDKDIFGLSFKRLGSCLPAVHILVSSRALTSDRKVAKSRVHTEGGVRILG